jgi:ribosomal-protein-alanine N-acetyltransferase
MARSPDAPGASIDEEARVGIRPMTAADVAAVMAIEAASYPTAWGAEDFLRFLARERNRYWVAERDGVLVGYTGLELDGALGHITTVTVSATERRGGIGRRMMDVLMDEARAHGVREVRLEVGLRNRPARALYRAFGFTDIGVRRGYYPGEDAVIMRWLPGGCPPAGRSPASPTP